MYYSLDIIGITDEEQGLLIRDAVESTLLELIPHHWTETYEITIYVSDADEMGEAMGLVCEEDDFEYTIMIKKELLDDPLELFKTVVHETVHITQYIKKDLIHLPGNKTSWFGSIIEVEYNERPWEIQAYSVEEKLACLFVNNQQ